MTFNSLAFVIFYPAVLLLYFLLPKRARLPLLLVASYFFYMYYQPSLIVLILATTVISWLSALGIEKSQNPALRRALLVLTLVVCLGVLFFYKYFDFLMGSVVGLIRYFGGENLICIDPNAKEMRGAVTLPHPVGKLFEKIHLS